MFRSYRHFYAQTWLSVIRNIKQTLSWLELRPKRNFHLYISDGISHSAMFTQPISSKCNHCTPIVFITLIIDEALSLSLLTHSKHIMLPAATFCSPCSTRNVTFISIDFKTIKIKWMTIFSILQLNTYVSLITNAAIYYGSLST